MKTYKKGDTVRVTLVGEVADEHDDRFVVIRQANAQTAWITIDVVESVEVLASPISVGDVVPGPEIMARKNWKEGTVLAGSINPSYVLVYVGDGAWQSVSGMQHKTLTDPYRVVYLP